MHGDVFFNFESTHIKSRVVNNGHISQEIVLSRPIHICIIHTVYTRKE